MSLAGGWIEVATSSTQPARSWSVCARSVCWLKVQAARSSNWGLACTAGGGRPPGRWWCCYRCTG